MSLIPAKKQLAFLDWEFGVFFHFGIRSFYPGHRDWDGVDMPADGFMPTELDVKKSNNCRETQVRDSRAWETEACSRLNR